MRIASRVPTWTMTSKRSPTCPNRGMSISAAERWPSEETGMNSVSPWMTPRRIASSQLTRRRSYHAPGPTRPRVLSDDDRHDHRPQPELAAAGALGGDRDLRAEPLGVGPLLGGGAGEDGARRPR